MPDVISSVFSGKPLEGSKGLTKFYDSFRTARCTAKLGDIVEIARDDGTFIGIILVLWQQGRQRLQYVEILWFEWPTMGDVNAVG